MLGDFAVHFKIGSYLIPTTKTDLLRLLPIYWEELCIKIRTQELEEDIVEFLFNSKNSRSYK